MGRMVRTIAAVHRARRRRPCANQQCRHGRRRGLRARVHGRVRRVAGDVLRRGGEDVRLKGLARRRSSALALIAPAAASAGRLRPVGRVQAQGLGADPPRPARPVDQPGRRLPPRRRRAHDPARHRPMRWRVATVAGTRQTVGEVIYDIAQTQVAETGLPTKAIGALVPLRRDAADLHLRRQPARVHPAAAHRARPTTAFRSGASTRRRRRSR